MSKGTSAIQANAGWPKRGKLSASRTPDSMANAKSNTPWPTERNAGASRVAMGRRGAYGMRMACQARFDQVLQFPEVVGRADDFERFGWSDELIQGLFVHRGQH